MNAQAVPSGGSWGNFFPVFFQLLEAPAPSSTFKASGQLLLTSSSSDSDPPAFSSATSREFMGEIQT